jgi:hypothetical protein
VEIVAATFVPFLSALHLSNAGRHFPFIKSENLSIVVGTTTALARPHHNSAGILQPQRYQPVRVTHREACESVKHEKFTYTAGAGVYASAANPHALLAERAENHRFAGKYEVDLSATTAKGENWRLAILYSYNRLHVS